MARAILNPRHVRALILALCCAVPAAAGAATARWAACPRTLDAASADQQRQYVEFRRAIDSGPLARQLGRRVWCDARVESGSIALLYRYAGGATLEAKRDPAIELTEQRLTRAGMAGKKALARLQRTEKWAFEGRGCNIDWTVPPTSEAGPATGASSMVYRGDTCNCQARLEYRDQVLKALVFRSAC